MTSWGGQTTSELWAHLFIERKKKKEIFSKNCLLLYHLWKMSYDVQHCFVHQSLRLATCHFWVCFRLFWKLNYKGYYAAKLSSDIPWPKFCKHLIVYSCPLLRMAVLDEKSGYTRLDDLKLLHSELVAELKSWTLWDEIKWIIDVGVDGEVRMSPSG